MKELAEMKLLIEKLEKTIGKMPTKVESGKHGFIPGEWVQVRDTSDEAWSWPRKFIRINESERYVASYRDIDKDINKIETSWSQCRRPVDVPGILIPWFGGECPVSDKNALTMVILRYGVIKAPHSADYWRWIHDGTEDDIVEYMIMPKR